MTNMLQIFSLSLCQIFMNSTKFKCTTDTQNRYHRTFILVAFRSDIYLSLGFSEFGFMVLRIKLSFLHNTQLKIHFHKTGAR